MKKVLVVFAYIHQWCAARQNSWSRKIDVGIVNALSNLVFAVSRRERTCISFGHIYCPLISRSRFGSPPLAPISAPGIKSRVFALSGKQSSWFVGHLIALYTYLAVYITQTCMYVSRMYMCRVYTYLFGVRVAKQHVYMQVEANSRCIGIMCEIYMDESEATYTCMRVYVRSHDGSTDAFLPECQIIDWLGQIRRRASFSLFLARYICEYEGVYIYMYVWMYVCMRISTISLSVSPLFVKRHTMRYKMRRGEIRRSITTV